MTTEVTHLLLLTISTFWSSSRWPFATKVSSRRQRSIPLGGRYRQVSLYQRWQIFTTLWQSDIFRNSFLKNVSLPISIFNIILKLNIVCVLIYCYYSKYCGETEIDLEKLCNLCVFPSGVHFAYLDYFNPSGRTIKVWEWISNFTSPFIIVVINLYCWWSCLSILAE